MSRTSESDEKYCIGCIASDGVATNSREVGFGENPFGGMNDRILSITHKLEEKDISALTEQDDMPSRRIAARVPAEPFRPDELGRGSLRKIASLRSRT
jgi:hypothetical protein